MRVKADGKRRVVLPKSVQPGDVFQVLEEGNGKLFLQRLKSHKPKPLVSANPLRAEDFQGIDLDAPIQEWDKG
jgi:hypothetical protein